jgi:hypothetical protein
MSVDATSLRRSLHVTLAGLLLPSGLVAGSLALVDAPASAASIVAPSAVVPPLSVTVTKVADPRYGDPLLLDIKSTGNDVAATVRYGNTELMSKPVSSKATRFEIPTTNFKAGTEYRLDVDVANEQQSGTALVRFTPQFIAGTVHPASMTISYSAPLYIAYQANEATTVVPTGWAAVIEEGQGSFSTKVRTDGTAALLSDSLTPGEHQVEVRYLGDAAHAVTGPGTGSHVGTLTVAPMPTTTAANLSASVITQGDPLNVIASIRSADPLTTKDPTGWLRVDAIPQGGGQTLYLASVPYEGGQIAKTIDLSEFASEHSGTWVLRTTNTGNTMSKTSYSESTLRIDKPGSVTADTTTSLTLDSDHTTAGGTAVDAVAQVTVDGGAAPDGQVAFYLDGAQVGAAGVGSNGSARVPISATRAGEHIVTAHYLGSATQGYSVSEERTLTVDKANTKVTVGATGSVKAGTKVPITVEAIDSTLVPPAGTVLVHEGTRSLGMAGILAGRGSFQMPMLERGTHVITFDYPGSPDLAASHAQITVTVKPATPTPKAASKIKASFKKIAHHKVRAVVKVISSRKVTGRVEIRLGKRIVARGVLKPGAKFARVVLKTKKLQKGKRKLVVRYLGSPTVKAAKKAYRVRVR